MGLAWFVWSYPLFCWNQTKIYHSETKPNQPTSFGLDCSVDICFNNIWNYPIYPTKSSWNKMSNVHTDFNTLDLTHSTRQQHHQKVNRHYESCFEFETSKIPNYHTMLLNQKTEYEKHLYNYVLLLNKNPIYSSQQH